MSDVQYTKVMQNPGGFMVRRVDTTGAIVWIPPDEANSDYAAFVAWVADGNEPEVISA